MRGGDVGEREREREVDIRDALIERLVVSATTLWRVVLRAEAAPVSGRASLALVAQGLTRSFEELAGAIEIVLGDPRSTP
jgi:hypothetical protein